MLSLGAVAPFLAVLVSPKSYLESDIGKLISELSGSSTVEGSISIITIFFIIFTIIAGATRLTILWANTRFAFSVGTVLSSKMYERTLYQDYSIHISRNSGEVISTITSKVWSCVNCFSQILTLASSLILLFVATLALVFLKALWALIAAAILGGCYVLMSYLVRSYLQLNAEKISLGHTKIFIALQEGLGSIRDVILDGTQKIYCDIYNIANIPLLRAAGENTFISAAPRYLIEILTISLIAGFAYILSLGGENSIVQAIPVLGAIALGAQRVLPSLQQAYASWTSIIGNASSLSDTIDLLDQPISYLSIKKLEHHQVNFNNLISFCEVNFSYQNSEKLILKNFNLKLPQGKFIGVIGETGGGKSTFLDLLMGLLEPTTGSVLVDNEPLVSGRLHGWRKCVAHVPQSVFIADANFLSNIALGADPGAYDIDEIKTAANLACISDFIVSLPNGYHSILGERGAWLSGGQRQRIGIARALIKKNSKLLVLDEATSALDVLTERRIIDNIKKAKEDITIVMVTHRISTIINCDLIVEIGEGKVRGVGTYNELLSGSPTFREMVLASFDSYRSPN